MAKNSIRDYSATNSDNTDIQSINIAEGCSPAGINNAIREVMADLKDVSTGAVALESPAADSLSVTGDLTVDTDTLYVDSTNNRVGIGQSSPNQKLDVNGNIVTDSYSLGAGNGIFLRRGFETDAQPSITVEDHSGSAPDGLSVNGGDGVSFKTGGSERMRIKSNGHVDFLHNTRVVNTVGDDPAYNNASSPSGVEMTNSGFLVFVANDTGGGRFCRTGTDGNIVTFYAQGNSEGTISVSGSTVSYNGGHLARWSQLTDNTRDETLVKGTVMTNLDQMAEWTNDGVTEDNEQLNCMAVSSVEGDANVAGVFVNWDNDDDIYHNDMNIAMTGDMVIRIASGTTVARGDLLMSAGDGTAKPQGDDIVRSKTIAKVTSTNVSHTYDDGSYLVPCVLMAC